MKYLILSGNRQTAVYDDADQLWEILAHDLVPLYLKHTGDFAGWVEQRAIDGTRSNARMLKKAQRLSSFSPDFETAMKYNAACITDNFWVHRLDGAPLPAWEEIRFRDDVYFRMAVSSDDSAFSHKPSRTPELTNIGSREKGWRLENGSWWLYKRDEYPEHELLAYQIGTLLGYDMAHYEMQDGMIRTRDFTAGRANLQHIDALLGDNEDFADNYTLLQRLDPALARQYLDILCLDAIINNPDRHTKNYGFLTSQENGSILCMAPNYDNDMAFYGIRQEWFSWDVSNRLMENFLEFLHKQHIRLTLPALDPAEVEHACGAFPQPYRTAEYIMGRYHYLQEHAPR